MLWSGVHAIVIRARRGDAEAWQFLHALTRGYLYGMAQGLVGPGWPHRSVQDLVQETWTRATKGLDDFHGGGDDAQTGAMLRAWLGKIMKRVHLNGVRDDNASIRHPGGQACNQSLNLASLNGSASRYVV